MSRSRGETPRAFEDVEVGEDLPDAHPDVSLVVVRGFAEGAHMQAGRFTDHSKARAEGLPGAIVPGIMSQGILAAMIHRWAPGSRIRKIDTVFRAPVLVDSSPVGHAVVTDTDAAAKTVQVDLTLENEAGETRVMGTAIVQLD